MISTKLQRKIEKKILNNNLHFRHAHVLYVGLHCKLCWHKEIFILCQTNLTLEVNNPFWYILIYLMFYLMNWSFYLISRFCKCAYCEFDASYTFQTKTVRGTTRLWMWWKALKTPLWNIVSINRSILMFNQRLLHWVWKGSVAHKQGMDEGALHVFTKENTIVAEMSDLKLTVRRKINRAFYGSVKLIITHWSQNVKVRDSEAWLMGQREEPLGLMTFSLKTWSSPVIPFLLTCVFDILCCLYNTRITRISNTIAPTWFTTKASLLKLHLEHETITVVAR